MTNENGFIGYEYKNITVKRDAVSIYADCLKNFGWDLIEEHDFHNYPVNSDIANVHQHTATTDGLEMVSLKFKRDRNISKKIEINRLERTCEEALSAIDKLEEKSKAYSMGIALGSGIIGTGFLCLAIYNFMSANPGLGLGLALIGAAGWAVGLFAHRKVSKKESTKTEPMIEEQINIAYGACAQALALWA